jgi:hypothetical protein
VWSDRPAASTPPRTCRAARAGPPHGRSRPWPAGPRRSPSGVTRVGHSGRFSRLARTVFSPDNSVDIDGAHA